MVPLSNALLFTSLAVLIIAFILLLIMAARLVGPNTMLINAYGIPEIAVDTMFYQGFIADLDSTNQQILIGKPFNHARIYALDSSQKLVPISVAGKLFLGGLVWNEGI